MTIWAGGGAPHLVTPGSGYCNTGRDVGRFKQRSKPKACPNRAERGSLYCSTCLVKVLERMGVGR